MKTQKRLAVLATTSMLALSVGCNDRYAEGLKDGYDQGYTDGYTDGDTAGFERARTYFASADYLDGFSDGQASGIQIGYAQGYTVGKQDGNVEGYSRGYNQGKGDGRVEGYNTGYNDGYDDGYDDGNSTGAVTAYNNGYNDGYSDGAVAGYDNGYDDGIGDGYDMGYNDGFNDGWGLSVGKTKTLKGYANLLSMVHNDLFDYSKIKAPRQTAKGLVANGRLLLAENNQTSKDTLKKSAVVEQYLVVEMAKQVKAKFGLSAERSFKVAKAANHFRKYSSKRALTAEDTNAYAEEILGADFNEIQTAYSQSIKGNLSGLNSVLQQAADKNGVSPEKMGEIMTKFFL